ncbi:MAG: polyphosphate polymerase domain-containing protein [Acetatifactor sp.]
MQNLSVFRYERKYLINNLQVENYRSRIESICTLDPYAGEGGKYSIRSLYFDDYNSSAFKSNANGTDVRDKWRLRIYNRDCSRIRLEHKIKINEKVHKDYALVSRDFYESIIAGKQMEIQYPVQDKVVNQFLFDYFAKGLRPVVIVEYEREPYIFDAGDVRVTFDENIAYSGECARFLDSDLHLTPLTGIGKQLMEVKYTEFLPTIIHSALNMGTMQQTTFSKFYLCAKNEKIRGVTE